MELAREPLQLEAIYFISPTNNSIGHLATDADKGLYPGCHVFFTSAVPKEALGKIRNNRNLVRKLKTLREVTLSHRARIDLTVEF